MEIRPYVTFECDEFVDPSETPPFGKRVATFLVESLGKSCSYIDGPEDRDDAWGFNVDWKQLTINCTVAFLNDGPRQWLLATEMKHSWSDWLRGRKRYEEQQQFFCLLDQLLKAHESIRSIRWYTREQWDRDRGAWSDRP
jgi:hypothetical protein